MYCFRLHEFRAVAAALFPDLDSSAISFVDPAATIASSSSLDSTNLRGSSENTTTNPSTGTTDTTSSSTLNRPSAALATPASVSPRANMVYGGGWQRLNGPRRKTTAPNEGPEVPPVR